MEKKLPSIACLAIERNMPTWTDKHVLLHASVRLYCGMDGMVSCYRSETFWHQQPRQMIGQCKLKKISYVRGKNSYDTNVTMDIPPAIEIIIP